MNRRRFLAHLTRTAAGLLVGANALELLVEPRRKLWPGWGGQKVMTATEADRRLKVMYETGEVYAEGWVYEAFIRDYAGMAMKRPSSLIDTRGIRT